jgi:type VI secretion system secreted protein Hcp
VRHLAQRRPRAAVAWHDAGRSEAISSSRAAGPLTVFALRLRLGASSQDGVAVALNAYLRLVGAKQGEIKGSVTQKGREGKIMVIAVSHGIMSPHDPGSGQATGRRQHGPFVITKEADRATVPLRSMLVDNEVAKEWELQFWRSVTAAETQYFSIALREAVIVSIDLQMPNNKQADLMKLETFEEVAFTYRRIEWTWTDGGLVAADDNLPP